MSTTDKGCLRSTTSSAPKFILPLSDVVLSYAEQGLKLECRVTGYPRPEVRWEIGGKIIGKSRNIHMTRTGDRCVLEIKKLQIKDSGIYTCFACNIIGSVSSRCKITCQTSGDHIKPQKNAKLQVQNKPQLEAVDIRQEKQHQFINKPSAISSLKGTLRPRSLDRVSPMQTNLNRSTSATRIPRYRDQLRHPNSYEGTHQNPCRELNKRPSRTLTRQWNKQTTSSCKKSKPHCETSTRISKIKIPSVFLQTDDVCGDFTSRSRPVSGSRPIREQPLLKGGLIVSALDSSSHLKSTDVNSHLNSVHGVKETSVLNGVFPSEEGTLTIVEMDTCDSGISVVPRDISHTIHTFSDITSSTDLVDDPASDKAIELRLSDINDETIKCSNESSTNRDVDKKNLTCGSQIVDSQPQNVEESLPVDVVRTRIEDGRYLERVKGLTKCEDLGDPVDRSKSIWESCDTSGADVDSELKKNSGVVINSYIGLERSGEIIANGDCQCNLKRNCECTEESECSGLDYKVEVSAPHKDNGVSCLSETGDSEWELNKNCEIIAKGECELMKNGDCAEGTDGHELDYNAEVITTQMANGECSCINEMESSEHPKQKVQLENGRHSKIEPPERYALIAEIKYRENINGTEDLDSEEICEEFNDGIVFETIEKKRDTEIEADFQRYYTGKIRYSQPMIEECGLLLPSSGCLNLEDVRDKGLQIRDAETGENLQICCPLADTAARVVRGPQSVTVLRGESVTLAIHFSGVPQPRVIWMKGGTILQDGDRNTIIVGQDMSVLTVKNVTADDSGKYVVCVENDGGGDSCFASVAVVGFPEPPGGEPTASDYTDHSVVLSWYGSMYDGGSVVTGYIVEVRLVPDKKWERVASCVNTSYVVQGLSCGQQYIFRVRAENRYGVSHPSRESQTVCLDEYLGDDTDLRLENVDFPDSPVVIEVGTQFAELYELKEEVGKGRFGRVHRCIDNSTGRPRAAKVIRCIKMKDKDKVREEVAIMNRLSHPKLLKLLAAFESGRNMIMVTEYISGGELFERVIADDFILTESDCVLFMRQICEGVAYMHQSSVLHLDLKPENIMCKTRTSHQIKIIDFGLARVYDPDETLRVLFGTPEFVAPEVINYEPVGPASDMWSLGVICYVLLSGLSPFMGDSDSETFSNITRGEVDFDEEAFIDISQEAKNFISSLLLKAPRKRISTEDAIKHPWLEKAAWMQNKKAPLSTEKLKRFIIRRKWQKSGTAILALGRMVSLSKCSLGSNGDLSPLGSPTSLRSISTRSETTDSADSGFFQESDRSELLR